MRPMNRNLCMLLVAVSTAMLLSMAPPSGRPPVGPLERYDPHIYDISFQVLLSTSVSSIDQGIRAGEFTLRDTPIVMPLIMQSTFSIVDRDSIRAEMLGDRGAFDGFRRSVEGNLPFYSSLLKMNITEYRGATLRWTVSFKVQTWSSRFNDVEAQRIAWPRRWPDEVEDGLQPQQFIESDAEIFRKAIESQGGIQALRTVSPLIAAKQVLAYCLNNIRVSRNGLLQVDGGVLRGMDLQGAKRTAEAGIGTPNDLVCVCVAMLRAAGIPARPVVGVIEDEDGRDFFKSWAEFYLPDAGWVPFDPNAMQRKGAGRMDPTRPWPELGTMDRLKKHIPISFTFHPPLDVEAPNGPAIWGWKPRPGKYEYYNQAVEIGIASLGSGIEDPK